MVRTIQDAIAFDDSIREYMLTRDELHTIRDARPRQLVVGGQGDVPNIRLNQAQITAVLGDHKRPGYRNGVKAFFVDDGRETVRALAVKSDSFARIPLDHVYKTLVNQLGEPVKERQFKTVGIMLQFKPISRAETTITKYARELYPTFLVADNITETALVSGISSSGSMRYGFAARFPMCTNELFMMSGGITKYTRGNIRHTQSVVSRLDLIRDIKLWLHSVKKVDHLITRASETPCNPTSELIYYGKAASTQAMFLEFLTRPQSTNLEGGATPSTHLDVVNNVTHAFAPDYKPKFMHRVADSSEFGAHVKLSDLLVTPPSSFKLDDYFGTAKQLLTAEPTIKQRSEFNGINVIPFWEYLRESVRVEATMWRR